VQKILERRAKARAKRAELKAKGLCVACQGPTEAGHTFCNDCGVVHRIYERQRRGFNPHIPMSPGRPPIYPGEGE